MIVVALLLIDDSPLRGGLASELALVASRVVPVDQPFACGAIEQLAAASFTSAGRLEPWPS